MEIASSVVVEIVSKLVDASIHHALYPFRFNRYVKELQTQKDNLQSKIESVLDRAKESKKKTEKIVNDVEKWLNEADSLIAKVVELEEKARKRKKTTCLKYYHNWIRRYGLAKQLEEKTNEIIKHSHIEFLEFSRLATLVGMKYFSSEGFVYFDSRKGAYEGLLEALKDDNVHMIGLYGMGGCGKTIMAREVGKDAEQFFNKVIFVVVSNPINIRKIQGKIASQLGNFKLGEEEEPERAKRLFMKLTSVESFLIILDDVWEKLDFEDIGIPTGESQKGCTILITTREHNVCALMKCQRTILLKVLDEEEAWTLFQKHVEIMFDENSDTLKLKDLAQEITKECCGLPVAIAALASTLKNKTRVEWIEALETLKDSNLVDIEEGLKNPYVCLRLSYDNMKNEIVKSLFLLCSVFPEDFEIPVDLLSITGIGLGLLGEVHSYKRARNQVSIAKNKLINSCLLLEVDEEESGVKMHDLVRDVALWIAKKENKMIVGPEWSQKALKDDLTIKDARIRYLWLDEVDKFPHELDCPELEFLYVSTKSMHRVDLTDDFFKGMKKLRVLLLVNLRGNTIIQLSNLVHLINNLCCLILSGWLLGDVSFIGSLESLVSLQLLGCSFDELPKSISQQKNLRLLELRHCKIDKNPYEVIGRCSQLEELYFFGNEGRDWEDEGENAAEYFDKVSVTPALERYCINLGKSNYVLDREDFPITRSISIEYFDACISNATVKDLMQRAEFLSLSGINTSCKNIIPDVVQTIGRLEHLTKLSLSDSDKTECVIDTRNDLDLVGHFSNLTHLTVKRMKHLKTLCGGQPPQGLFAKLEVLEISECNSLEHIIPDKVGEIVVDDTEYQRRSGIAFPKLKTLFIEECNQLEYLIPVSFARSLPQLELLNISKSDKLKNVFCQSNYEDQNPNEFQIFELSALKCLHLSDLPNIISICPENYHLTWPSMESMGLYNCPQLITRPGLGHENHIVSEDLMKAMVTHLENLRSVSIRHVKVDVIFSLGWLPVNGKVVNSGLRDLWLSYLPELRHIWEGPKNFFHFQNLGELYIQECGNLKVIFPASISRSIPQLKTLRIWNCEELEEIIEENENVSNPQLLFPHLTTLIIRDCHKLKRVFPVSSSHVLPKLKFLWIEEASQLEQVFGDEQEETRETMEAMIPELKCLILVKLPRVTIGAQWTELQTVRYRVVHESPKLTFTSSHDLEDLLAHVEGDNNLRHFISWGLQSLLTKIIKSNEDSSIEITKQIHSKETAVESSSEREHISSKAKTNQCMLHISAQNNQNDSGIHSEEKMTSPNLTQSLNETTKDTDGELLGLEVPSVMETSSTDPKLINKQLSNNPLPISLHKTASLEPKQLVNERSTSEASLTKQQQPLGESEITNNEIPQGTKSVKAAEHQCTQEENISEETGVKGSVEGGSTSDNAKAVISLIHSKPTGLLPGPSVTSMPEAFSNESVDERSANEPSLTDKKQQQPQQPLGESKIIANNEIPQRTKIVKQPEDENQSSAQEENISEKTIVIGSIEESSTSENAKIIISSAHSKSASSLLATTKDDDLVAKAFKDLEVSLKMPLKDIATSGANSLRLLTALNFLSHLSFEDGALPPGFKAVIESLHQDFLGILYSFRPAFATVNELSEFMDKAQEKEARLKEQMEQISWLDKEIEDCEGKLLSLQERKKKTVAETIEFKKEFESVMKEKSEVVEDQRKAQQQLFQVDYRWSALCSQFQLNNFNVTRNPS